MNAIAMLIQWLSGSIDINGSRFILPENVDDGFIFERTRIWTVACFFTQTIYNSIFNFLIEEHGIRYRRMIASAFNAQVFPRKQNVFPLNLFQFNIQFIYRMAIEDFD